MKKTLIIIALALISLSANSQYLVDERLSAFYIDGNSTLHKWTAVVEQMSGSLHGVVRNGHIDTVINATIIIPTKGLKSGNSMMDNNIYDALKAEENSKIVYLLKKHKVHNSEMTVVGDLTIAGVTRTIESRVSHESKGDHIMINGQIKINMSDYQITPPEFFLGAFKTDDAVTISFYIMYSDNI